MSSLNPQHNPETAAANPTDLKKQETKNEINVTGIAPKSTEKTSKYLNLILIYTHAAVRDFFAFCGKIKSLKLSADGSAQKADIIFEKESGAKTALMLTNATIDGSSITVTAPHESYESYVGNADDKAGLDSAGNDEIAQEDKPRAAILAELLAHGYQLQDHVIHRGLDLDQKYGVSTRFTNYFNAIHANLKSVDEKYKVTDKATTHAKSIDEKYKVQDQLKQQQESWTNIGKSYYQKALSSPLGERVYQFYTTAQKQVLDVHNEAKRISEQRTAAGQPAIPGIAATSPLPSQKEALEKKETDKKDDSAAGGPPAAAQGGAGDKAPAVPSV